jgi:hypothetical protein
MDGAEPGKGVGIRWAKGFNRWWSWEMDGALIDAPDATFARFVTGGRAQYGQEGWVPVVHVLGGSSGGRVMGKTTFGMSGSLGLSVERELLGGFMISVGGQATAAFNVGHTFEAGAQIGARWK